MLRKPSVIFGAVCEPLSTLTVCLQQQVIRLYIFEYSFIMINYVKLTVPRWQTHQRIWSGRIGQLFISMVLPPCIFFLCVTRFTHSVSLLQVVLTMLFIKAEMCPGVDFSSSWSIFDYSHLRFSPSSAIVCSGGKARMRKMTSQKHQYVIIGYGLLLNRYRIVLVCITMHRRNN